MRDRGALLRRPARERDDDAAVVLAEVRHGLADQARRLEHVHPEQIVPARVPDVVGAVERRLARDARVDDDGVDARVLLEHLPPERAGRAGHGEVGLEEALALVGDRGDRRLGALPEGAVVRDDGSAAGADRGGGSGADPARGAGHDDGLAREIAQSIPPSIARSWPVIPDESPLARKSAASATSSTVAIRPRAVWAATVSSACCTGIPRSRSLVAIRSSSASVAIGPGPRALTRMPRRPRSSAADRVSPSTACLLAT